MKKKAAPRKRKPKSSTVVVAWVVEEMVPDGKPFAADLGQRPKFIPQDAAKAAVWKSDATDADLEKAVAYARSQFGVTGHVYAYPATVRDPLERARKDILAEKASAKAL